MPYAHIEYVSRPTTALITSVAGVRASGWARLINQLSAGDITITLEKRDLAGNYLGGADLVSPASDWVGQNNKSQFDFEFSMPNQPINIIIVSWALLQEEDAFGNPTGIWNWYPHEYSGPYRIDPAGVTVGYTKV